MDLLTRAINPWGESIFTHISWSLFWASLVGGLLFLLAHGGYMLFSRHEMRDPAEVDNLEAKRKGLPAKIERHSFVARMFHWVMAVSMLALLFTAFLPIVGVRFAWVEWHWWAGPAECSGPIADFSAKGSILGQLDTVHVVRCDEAAWRLLGISLAGYNVLISLALAAIAGYGLLASRRSA